MQRSKNIFQRKGRITGGNFGSTSGACETKRWARNGPVFSIRIMYCRSSCCSTTQGSKTFFSLGKESKKLPFVPKYVSSWRIYLNSQEVIDRTNFPSRKGRFHTSNQFWGTTTWYDRKFQGFVSKHFCRSLESSSRSFFIQIIEVVSLHLSSSTRFYIVLLFNCRRLANTSKNYEHVVFQMALQPFSRFVVWGARIR